MNLRNLDDAYSKALGIFNPYRALKYRITNDLPRFDAQAYRMNPQYQFVYDKLFIAKSQGMNCGTLDSLRGKKDIEFPIFIKPRYGHKSASSKNCYKIKSYKELEKQFHKPEMMWSEFVNATEGMTDFVLVNGEIVYQLTYKYSEKQHGFADDWKFISPETQPPSEIVEWVKQHMTGYIGPVNVQYRDVKIIEVGMRFARSGMYLESAGNKVLIDTINDMWRTKTWNHSRDDKLGFKPFYSFKSWSPIPLIYLLPQHVVDMIVRSNNCMTFYEYYFEPTGKSSLIFFQLLHHDFDQGMKTKKILEKVMLSMNVLVVLLFVAGVVLALNGRYWLMIVAIFVYLTTLDNSLDVIVHQIKNQKQFLGI
jgi:hypothetical protein